MEMLFLSPPTWGIYGPITLREMLLFGCFLLLGRFSVDPPEGHAWTAVLDPSKCLFLCFFK